MRVCVWFFLLPLIIIPSIVQAQGAKQAIPQSSIADPDRDHIQRRTEWFYRGRLVRGRPAADLRKRAYDAKLHMRSQRAAALRTMPQAQLSVSAPASGSWIPLGPAPLASDGSGNGAQDYGQVAGRATAVAIDPADPSGNTIYIGGAQSGVWKSSNAANATANSVTWTPLTDNQPTLSIGAIAIQPGNSDPTKSVILAVTGEADSSGDSYYGLGILRSADAGNTWTLISKANNGALSFSGLGGTRMAFSTLSAQTVVAALATTSEGLVNGAVTAGTVRGLYTSVDAGVSWTYDAITDPSGATDATSATSVVYNHAAGLFFAAIRYHGFYSSPDGLNWTRLAVQPGGATLGTIACPAQSTSNNRACPIYRGEITVVPGRKEMYVWYVSFAINGSIVDSGIWQSVDGGLSWKPISDSGIANCGDVDGCGVEQGAYNLALLAVPNGSVATDLYAGAVNLYKCAINSANPACSSSPFLNLTHVYGCVPAGAPAHVHPDQHALAATIPATGSDSGNGLMFFANDGGIYRALNGFAGLNSGSCSGINRFDNLNQNLGSMTQFVSFSQHPTDPNTLLGGTQDNGSPATSQATTNLAWINVLGGDGGYNLIDPLAPSNWYASNPDVPPGGLGIQFCSSGVNCNNSTFSYVVSSNTLGGDDGAFYFPYVFDPNSANAMLVGTCRVWRGPRSGGVFTALSPNFETLSSGICSGNEVNQVTALAPGGVSDATGSSVIYATTSGLGPLNGPLTNPNGGRVWVTTDATSGLSTFADVTENGPQGSINSNQFPISSVVLDASDATGNTAYVTVMGFTGGAGHVWKTTNAGLTWTDFTANLPDAPVNAVLVYPPMSLVIVGTDVGVFESSISAAYWTEVGPNAGVGQPGFLPNVAVTALAVFASGGQQLLRASTYGRGIWQFNLSSAPDFQLNISNSPQSILVGQTATFQGSAIALNGYNKSVALSCVAGATPPPGVCSVLPSSLTPSMKTPFSINAGGAVGDYYFNLQGVSSDSNHTTRTANTVLHILSSSVPDFSLSLPAPFQAVNAGSSNMGGSISVTASSGFTGVIALTCSLVSANGSCTMTPSTVTSIPAAPGVSINATSLSAGSYQLIVRGTSGAFAHTLLIPFNVGDYQLSGQPISIALGGQGTANVSITSTYYKGNIIATCDASALPGANNSTCALSPGSPISVTAGATVPLTATITVPAGAGLQTYNININTQDSSGVPNHALHLPINVEDFAITSATASQTIGAGQTAGPYNLNIQPRGASFDSAVALACTSGLPAGAQCVFSPATPVTPGASAQTVLMSVSTAATTGTGSYTVGVTGTSGALSHSVSVSLNVASNATPPDFQLAVTQPFPAVIAGSQPTAQVSVTPNYNGSIVATCDASSVRASCSVTPNSPQIAANTALPLKISINSLPSDISPNTYSIVVAISDASGQPSHSLQLPLTIVQDFSVTSATPSQTVKAGQTSGAYQLTIAPNPPGSAFTGAVTLSCTSGLPAGAQCSFNPSAPQTPGNSAVNVVMSISTKASQVYVEWPQNAFYAIGLMLPAVVVGWPVAARRKHRRRLSIVTVAAAGLLMSLLPSCSGVSSTGGGGTIPPPTTYHVTVTGTSPGTPADAGQSTVVALVVQ